MESPQQQTGARMADQPRHERYSSQMRSSHHAERGVADRERRFLSRKGLKKGSHLPRRATLWAKVSGDEDRAVQSILAGRPTISQRNNMAARNYLHPALLSRRAYILPMSPMPMRPTTKSSAPGNGAVDAMISITRDQPAPTKMFVLFNPNTPLPRSHR